MANNNLFNGRMNMETWLNLMDQNDNNEISKI